MNREFYSSRQSASAADRFALDQAASGGTYARQTLVRHKLAARRRRSGKRRGAALLELALSILVFLTLVLGSIDLGIGLLRYHQLTEAVRHLARQAAVHGNLANHLGPWGPASASGNAAGGDAIATTLRQRLTGIPASQVNYTVDWIDGGNDVSLDHRVRVAASYTYQPVTTFIFGAMTLNLQSTTIVHVAH